MIPDQVGTLVRDKRFTTGFGVVVYREQPETETDLAYMVLTSELWNVTDAARQERIIRASKQLSVAKQNK